MAEKEQVLIEMRSLLAARVGQLFADVEGGPNRMREWVMRPFLIQFQGVPNQDHLEIVLLPENQHPNRDRMNVLALSVALGDSETFAQLLEHVTAEDLNAEGLTVWGYRQPYSLYHIALDPNGITAFEGNRMSPGLIEGYRVNAATNAPTSEVVIDELCKIIRLLAVKGANPNWVPGTDYSAPPMAAGELRGHKQIEGRALEQLRAHLILAGAELTQVPLIRIEHRPSPADIIYKLAHQLHRNRTITINGIKYLKVLFRKKDATSSAKISTDTVQSILDLPYDLQHRITKECIAELKHNTLDVPYISTLHPTTQARFDQIDVAAQEELASPPLRAHQLFSRPASVTAVGETSEVMGRLQIDDPRTSSFSGTDEMKPSLGS